jgi:hypothetical protein
MVIRNRQTRVYIVTTMLQEINIRYWWANRDSDPLYAGTHASTQIKLVRQTMIVRLKLDDIDFKFRISFYFIFAQNHLTNIE